MAYSITAPRPRPTAAWALRRRDYCLDTQRADARRLLAHLRLNGFARDRFMSKEGGYSSPPSRPTRPATPYHAGTTSQQSPAGSPPTADVCRRVCLRHGLQQNSYFFFRGASTRPNAPYERKPYGKAPAPSLHRPQATSGSRCSKLPSALPVLLRTLYSSGPYIKALRPYIKALRPYIKALRPYIKALRPRLPRAGPAVAEEVRV